MFALLFTENTTGFEVQSCLATHASTRISARAEAENGERESTESTKSE